MAAKPSTINKKRKPEVIEIDTDEIPTQLMIVTTEEDGRLVDVKIGIAKKKIGRMNVWPCGHLPVENGPMRPLWPAGRLARRPMAGTGKPKKITLLPTVREITLLPTVMVIQCK